MRKVKFLVASLLFCAMSYAGYMGYERVTMSEAERFMQANVEALTSGEVLPGKICYYKGTDVYTDLIPCTADYPNIGPCGDRIQAFYSKSNTAQCYK